MKRLLSAALALSLLSGTAAFAEPFDHRGGHYDSDRGRHDWDGRGHRGHGNDAGTAIAVGVGLLALTAIIAASHDRDRQAQYDRRRDDGYYRNDAPQPEYRRDGPPPSQNYDDERGR